MSKKKKGLEGLKPNKAYSYKKFSKALLADMPTDEELVERGYLTIEQFVDRYADSLKHYMRRNWVEDVYSEALHHPEDLASSAYTYTEIMFYVIGDFK